MFFSAVFVDKKKTQQVGKMTENSKKIQLQYGDDIFSKMFRKILSSPKNFKVSNLSVKSHVSGLGYFDEVLVSVLKFWPSFRLGN